MKFKELELLGRFLNTSHICHTNQYEILQGDCAGSMDRICLRDADKIIRHRFKPPASANLLQARSVEELELDSLVSIGYEFEEDFNPIFYRHEDVVVARFEYNTYKDSIKVSEELWLKVVEKWFRFCRKLGFVIHKLVKSKNSNDYLLYFSLLPNYNNLYQYTYIRAAFSNIYFPTPYLFYKIKENMPQIDDFRAFLLAQSIISNTVSYNNYYGFSNNNWLKTEATSLYNLFSKATTSFTNYRFQKAVDELEVINSFEITDPTTGEIIYSNYNNKISHKKDVSVERNPFYDLPLPGLTDRVKDIRSRKLETHILVINQEATLSFNKFANRVLVQNIWTECETKFIFELL